MTNEQSTMKNELALGLIEVTGFAATLVVLDALDKAADVALVQIELNDFYGTQVKIRGEIGPVRAALNAAVATARSFNETIVAHAINAPADVAWSAFVAKPEVNPLLEAEVVYFPKQSTKENPVSENGGSFAIGLIETQGFTAVMEALDRAAKAGNIEVIGREKLGGGYITVIFKGDVAAVKAAVAAGRERVDELGKLIAAHVIARPSEAVLSLLPKS
jgi:microcompartment protein CcmL/EutN